MNCEECPFKGSPQIQGEGSRFLETEEDMLDSSGNTMGKKIVKHFDNEGQYDVVCVGMAPAREEVKQGRVLIGASGQILRRTIESMGITEYYLCNVLLCPIEEEGASEEAIKCCGDRCLEEIKARNPKLTIALGDMPLRYLTENLEYTIRECEGRVIPSKVGPLLPVTHPAYYWRRPTEFFDFVECTRSGIRFLSGNYDQAVEPEMITVTPDNLDEVRNYLDKHAELAIDTETTSLSAYGWSPGRILEMGLAVEKDKAFVVPVELIKEFKQLLEEKKGIYWNAQFDASFLKQMGINPKVEYDGLLAHYSIDERGNSHGLKRVARIYLGCENWSKALEEYLPRRKDKEDIEDISYEVIPPEVRRPYLAKDVTRTYQLKHVLDKDVNRYVFDNLLMPACRMFIEIQHRGMRVNPVRLMEMAPVIEQDMSNLEKEIHDLAGEWLNPNSYKQVGELLYDKLEYPIDPYFQRSTSKQALELYIGDPLVDSILEYRQLSKLGGTYVMGFAKFVDQNYRIHPNINLFKAVTGRLSSDRPSIMNIKVDSKLKEIFLPDEGQILLHGDIKGNELRWYGIINKDEYILELFRKSFEAMRNGASEEELLQYDPHHQVGLVAYGSDELSKQYRSVVKAGVFGQIYQRTRKSMAHTFGEDKVDAVMAAVSQTVPDIKRYYAFIKSELRTKGCLESYFHRKRRFGLLTPDTIKYIEREAVNYPIQSSGSDTMLLSMLHLWEEKEKWGIWPFWPVHDSITMNGWDPKILPEIKKELEDYCYDLVGGVCPFVWEMAWGINWALQKPDEPGFQQKMEV